MNKQYLFPDGTYIMFTGNIYCINELYIISIIINLKIDIFKWTISKSRYLSTVLQSLVNIGPQVTISFVRFFGIVCPSFTFNIILAQVSANLPDWNIMVICVPI